MTFLLAVVLASLVSGLVLFSVWHKHVLISLLSLEYMVVGLLILFFCSMVNYMFMFCLIYLTFTACEGSLGLGVLVSVVRSHGGDYFSGFYLY